MHVALVTHKLVKGDGQGRVNLEVAAAALRRGWRLSLVATEVDPDLVRVGAVHVPINVRGWPTALLRHQAFALASAMWLQRHRAEIDVVHANGFITWARADVNTAHYVHAGWLASPYRPRARRTVRGLYQHAYSRLNAALERRAYRGSGCVIAVSARTRLELEEIGVDRERIGVIPNGVDTREFRPVEAAQRRSERGMVGLFVGDLETPRKNLQTVLRALRHCPGVRLLVAGTVGASPYPSLAKSLDVASRVEFLGFRDDVPALMRRADFVVFPSLYEPSGLVLLEGLASGVPVITARSVGGTEISGEDCTIVVGDPCDEHELAAAMRRLEESPDLRARMGALGRQRALALDFAAMAERYCDVYARTAGGAHAWAEARSGS